MSEEGKISRRALLTGAAVGMPATMLGAAFAQPPAADDNYTMTCDVDGNCTMTEIQQGDPDLASESVSVKTDTVGDINSPINRGSLASRLPDFRTKFYNTALEYVGFNRTDNKSEITEICRTLVVPFTYEEAGKVKHTAYCAAGLSYMAALTYAKASGLDLSTQRVAKLQEMMPEIAEFHFYPTVSCVNMMHVALGTRRWIEPAKVEATTLKQGMLVLFDWKKSGSFYKADHCGIVDSYDAGTKTVSTLEFNTVPEGVKGSQSDGGYVARRKRPLAQVKGFIDPDVKNPFSVFR